MNVFDDEDEDLLQMCNDDEPWLKVPLSIYPIHQLSLTQFLGFLDILCEDRNYIGGTSRSIWLLCHR